MTCQKSKQNNMNVSTWSRDVILKICRVCMKKSDSMSDLFHSDSNIVEKIQFCTGLLLTKKVNLPSSICLDCVTQLNTAHNFKSVCINSDNTFRTLLKDVKVEVKYEDLGQGSLPVKKEECSNDDDDKSSTDYKEVEAVIEKCPIQTTSKRRKVAKFRRLFCEKCNLQFANKQESQAHYLKHRPEYWICEFCGKKSLHPSSHRSHMRTHCAPKHVCTHCDYATVREADLKTHLTLHTGERRFRCEQCAGSFRTALILRSHALRAHGGQKRHACDRCAKRFYDRSEMLRHRATHDNLKRFACEVCHSRFASWSYWKRHMAKQHAVHLPAVRPGRRRASISLPDTDNSTTTNINASSIKVCATT